VQETRVATRIGCPFDRYWRKNHHNPITYPEKFFLKNRICLRRRESCTILWWTGDWSGMPRRTAQMLALRHHAIGRLFRRAPAGHGGISPLSEFNQPIGLGRGLPLRVSPLEQIPFFISSILM
jgi:hypothetical protein